MKVKAKKILDLITATYKISKIRWYRLLKKYLKKIAIAALFLFFIAPSIPYYWNYTKELLFSRLYFFECNFSRINIKIVLIFSIAVLIIPILLNQIDLFLKKIDHLIKLTNRSDEKEVKELIKELTLQRKKVIVLDGEWGCGKTTLYKEYIQYEVEKNFKRRNYKFTYVSCFGLKNINDLITQILNQTTLFELLGIVSRYFRLALESSTSFKRSLIPANSFITLDDFERFDENSYKEALGLIDYLVHQKHCRILIICNEQKIIESEQYKDFKEKVVDDTIPCPISEKVIFDILQATFPKLMLPHNTLQQAKNISEKQYNLRCFSRALFDFKELNEEINEYIAKFSKGKLAKALTLYWEFCQPQALTMIYIKASNYFEEAKVEPSGSDKIINAMSDKSMKGKTCEEVIKESESQPLSALFHTLGLDFKYDAPYGNPPKDLPKWLKTYLQENIFSWKEFTSDERILIANLDYLYAHIQFDLLKLYEVAKGSIEWILNSKTSPKHQECAIPLYFTFLVIKNILQINDEWLAFEILKILAPHGDLRGDFFQALDSNTALAKKIIMQRIKEPEEQSTFIKKIKHDVESMLNCIN